MSTSEDRYNDLPYTLRAYAEKCVLGDWSTATSDDKFQAQKLAFAINDFTKSALKSLRQARTG